jgi:hypothetical protein
MALFGRELILVISKVYAAKTSADIKTSIDDYSITFPSYDLIDIISV